MRCFVKFYAYASVSRRSDSEIICICFLVQVKIYIFTITLQEHLCYPFLLSQIQKKILLLEKKYVSSHVLVLISWVM